jgi:hypothetical protein
MADTMEDKGRDASRIESLWMLYISSGLVFAIGIPGVGELLHLPVISRWFIRKLGTARPSVLPWLAGRWGRAQVSK